MKKKLMLAAVAVLFLTSVAVMTACSTTGSHEMMDDSSKTMQKETMQDKMTDEKMMDHKMMDEGGMKSSKSGSM